MFLILVIKQIFGSIQITGVFVFLQNCVGPSKCLNDKIGVLLNKASERASEMRKKCQLFTEDVWLWYDFVHIVKIIAFTDCDQKIERIMLF